MNSLYGILAVIVFALCAILGLVILLWYNAIRIKKPKLGKGEVQIDEWRSVDTSYPRQYNMLAAYQAGKWSDLIYQGLKERGAPDIISVYMQGEIVPGDYSKFKVDDDHRVKVIFVADFEKMQTDPSFEPMTYRVPIEFFM